MYKAATVTLELHGKRFDGPIISNDGGSSNVIGAQGLIMTESPFLSPSEVTVISRISAVTRWRQEKLGHFPKRIKLTSRKIAYRRSDIEEWSRDPEAWRSRHEAEGAAA